MLRINNWLAFLVSLSRFWLDLILFHVQGYRSYDYIFLYMKFENLKFVFDWLLRVSTYLFGIYFHMKLLLTINLFLSCQNFSHNYRFGNNWIVNSSNRSKILIHNNFIKSLHWTDTHQLSSLSVTQEPNHQSFIVLIHFGI